MNPRIRSTRSQNRERHLSESPAGRRRAAPWKIASLVFAGLTASCIAGEGLVRLGGIAPEVAFISAGRFQLSSNPKIGYEAIPHYECTDDPPPWFAAFPGKGNSLGFRDHEHERKKREGVYRILTIGDSISMGLMVDASEDIYTSVLERTLREKNRNVEVLNFGVAGYNTQQEVATLIEKGLDYHPDLVLLQYCLNDRQMVNGGVIESLLEREGKSSGIERSLLDSNLSKSALYRFLRYAAFPQLRERMRAQRRVAMQELTRDTVEENFALLGRTSREEGFEVLVVVFPLFDRNLRSVPREHTAIARCSASNGFRHLDLLHAFRKCSASRRVYANAMHPNRFGHACAAQAIARHLEASELVGQQGSL
jgi:hypothetical protein